MKIAVSYLRFSTPEQKLGNSAERQLQIYRDYCRSHNLQPDETLSMAEEGLSAYKGEHLKKDGALGMFLAAVKDGKFPNHVLVAENLDRISRQGPKQAREDIAKIVDFGVDMHIVNINVQLTPGWENDPARSIIVDVELGRAWKESVYKSDRIGSAWRSKKTKAVNGMAITSQVPAWLKAEIGKPVEVRPERAAIVKKIFTLAALGLGAYKITGRLTADGDKPFSENGDWTLPYIKKILKSRAVLGEFQPCKRIAGKRPIDGEPISGYFPAVVSQTEWDAARSSVIARTRNYTTSSLGYVVCGGGAVTNLFTGLLFDATLDGRSMSFRSKSGRNKLDYLVTAYKAGQPQNSMRLDRFETAFLGFLDKADWDAIAGESDSPEVKALQAELETVLTKLDRSRVKIIGMQRLVDEGMFSKSLFESLDTEKAKAVEYQAQKESLAVAVASARASAEALYRPEDLIEAIRSGNSDLRLKLKSEIAKRISRIDLHNSIVLNPDIEMTDGEGNTLLPAGQTVAQVSFVNGATKWILFEGDRAILLESKG